MKTVHLLERYRALLAEIDTSLPLAWAGDYISYYTKTLTLTPEALDRFADFAIGGIGFEFGNDLPFEQMEKAPTAFVRCVWDGEQNRKFRGLATARLEESLHRLMAFPFAELGQALDLLRVDGVVGGRALSVEIGGRRIGVSLHTLKVAHRAYAMRAAHGSWPGSVIEIGGGHGRFIRDVARCSPATRLFYSDLPLNLVLAARYLSRVFPGEVSLVWADSDRIDPAARFTLIAPWHLDRLEVGLELCCNFDSFQHMRAENLAFYTAVLKRTGVQAIFHKNRSTALHPGEIDLAAYPWWDGFEVESSEVEEVDDVLARVDGGAVRRVGRVEAVRQYLRHIKPAD